MAMIGAMVLVTVVSGLLCVGISMAASWRAATFHPPVALLMLAKWGVHSSAMIYSCTRVLDISLAPKNVLNRQGDIKPT